jgi:hypothetical protein
MEQVNRRQTPEGTRHGQIKPMQALAALALFALLFLMQHSPQNQVDCRLGVLLNQFWTQ